MLGTMGSGMLLFVLFLLVERREAEPILPLSLSLPHSGLQFGSAAHDAANDGVAWSVAVSAPILAGRAGHLADSGRSGDHPALTQYGAGSHAG